MLRERSVYAQVVQLGNKKGGSIEWKVFVCYDNEHYLVIMHGHLVTVYVEREMPDSMGTTLPWPANMTGVRSSAIECVRRMRFGDVG